MIKDLKAKSMKNIVGRIIIGVIALVVIAGIFVPSIIKMFSVPNDLATVPLDKLEGAYVQSEITAIYDNFYYYTEESDGTEHIDINYYTIPIGTEEFCVIGLKDDFYSAETLYNESYAYMYDEIDEITSTFNVTGTFEKMDSEVYEMYIQIFSENGYTQEEINRLALPYVLIVNQIGDFDKSTLYFSMVGMVLLLLFILYHVIMAITGSNLSPIKKQITEMGSINGEEKMELDYTSAFAVEGNLFIGQIFSFFTSGTKVYALKNSDIVWAYLEQITRRVYGIKTSVNKSLIIYDKNKKKYTIAMKKEENVLAALNHYSNTHTNIVLGFNNQLKKLFKKDYDSFLTLAKSQSEVEQAAETFPSNNID